MVVTAPIPERHPDRSTRTEEAMSDTPLSRVRAFQRAANPNGDYHWPAEEAANIGGVPLYFDDIEALSSTDDLDAVEVAIRRLREAEAERDAAAERAKRADAELKKLESILEDACEQTEKARDERDALEEALARARQQNADLIAAWKQGNERRDRLDGLNSGLQRSALEDALEQRTRAEQAEERAAKAEAALAEMRKVNSDHPRCCTCGKNLGYRNVGNQLFCWPCADGESPEARTALERAAAEQGVPLVCDADKLTAPEDERLSDEEWTAYAEALGIEQGDGRDHTFEMLDDDAPKQNPRAVAEYWHEWADTCSNGGRDDEWTTVARVVGRILAAMADEQGDGEGGGA